MSRVNRQLIEQTEKVPRWVGCWLSDDDEFGYQEYETLELHQKTLELQQKIRDTISLHTKCMLFDLEVTKRENALLLKLLNEMYDKHETKNSDL